MNSYPAVGNVSQLTGSFTNQAGVAVDPTTITVQVRAPDGTITTSTPSRQKTGVYTFALSLTLPGQYIYRFIGTGAVTAQSGDTPLQVNPASF